MTPQKVASIFFLCFGNTSLIFPFLKYIYNQNSTHAPGQSCTFLYLKAKCECAECVEHDQTKTLAGINESAHTNAHISM